MGLIDDCFSSGNILHELRRMNSCLEKIWKELETRNRNDEALRRIVEKEFNEEKDTIPEGNEK